MSADPFQALLERHRRHGWLSVRLGYLRLLAEEPRHDAVLQMIAMGLDGEGDRVGAVRHFLRALALAPQSVDARANLAHALLGLGQARRAATESRRALAMAPQSVAALVNFATAEQASGLFDRAETWLRRTIHLAPLEPQAYANLAPILGAESRWAEAASACRRLLDLRPDYPDALRSLSAALHHQDRLEEEVSILRRLERLDPEDADAHCALRNASRRLGQGLAERTDAMDWAARHRAAGEAHERSGHVVEAAESYARALAFDPGDRAAAAALAQSVAGGVAWLQNAEVPEHARTNGWFRLRKAEALGRYRIAVDAVPSERAASSPRVFDCFTFFNEFELLDLRLEELADHVDAFVIVESPWTNRGDPKPLHFQDNRERYRRYADKIVHVVSDERVSSLAAEQFTHQKNALLRGLGNSRDRDMVVVSDLDEIPRPEALGRARRSMADAWDFARLDMDLYHYYADARTFRRWRGAALASASFARAVGPMNLQILAGHSELGRTIADAGWHFSWLGGAERIQTKLRSFGHKELDRPDMTNLERIRERLERREHVIDQTGEYTSHYGVLTMVPVDERFPASLRRRLPDLARCGFLAATSYYTS